MARSSEAVELDFVSYGDLADTRRPLALLLHGFPDTPHTWRHLGPELAAAGYRVAAPWLRGYQKPHPGPISAGTYVKDVLELRERLDGDGRTVLVGHDWGAQAAYGAVNIAPEKFHRMISLAIAPVAALGGGMFSYRQLKRSFYIWFIQTGAIADMVMSSPGFWEALWHDWSPGYDSTGDVAKLREHVTADNIANVLAPYRASFQPELHDPGALNEAQATTQAPSIQALCICGQSDGAIGSELLTSTEQHLPVAGSRFELLDDVGHFLHLEKPELINRLILDWLQWG